MFKLLLPSSYFFTFWFKFPFSVTLLLSSNFDRYLLLKVACLLVTIYSVITALYYYLQ